MTACIIVCSSENTDTKFRTIPVVSENQVKMSILQAKSIELSFLGVPILRLRNWFLWTPKCRGRDLSDIYLQGPFFIYMYTFENTAGHDSSMASVLSSQRRSAFGKVHSKWLSQLHILWLSCVPPLWWEYKRTTADNWHCIQLFSQRACLTAISRKVSKPRESWLDLSNRFGIGRHLNSSPAELPVNF